MSVVDLHPEDLIDKDGRGDLTEAESLRLHAHLARCATCRFERQLRADFADEMEGEPLAVNVAALLESGAAMAPPPVPPPAAAPVIEREPPASHRVSPRRRRMKATLLVAAATLLGVSVAGASGVGTRAWSWLAERADTSTLSVKAVSVPGTPAASPTIRARARSIEAHEAQSIPEVTDVAIHAPEASPPRIAARHRHDAATAGASSAAASPVSAMSTASAASSASAPAAPPADAAALFEAANDARRHGDYARALSIHRDLQARFGRSQEARVARATVGRLLLDRGDPAGALDSFDAYLGDGAGALGEEAMAGRATALDRLGRTEEARRAWSALLSAYPAGAYAAHARARAFGAAAR